MAKNGLHLITPTSIAYTGTSASISANGSVSFLACSAVEFRGVFSADYDNYLIAFRAVESASNNDTQVYFQNMSGTSPASGANYTHQFLVAENTIVGGDRTSGDTGARLAFTSYQLMSGSIIYFYGPYLAQPTAMRSIVTQTRNGSVRILDQAATHSLSTSYDGTKMFTNAGQNISGRVAVYGMRK